MRKAQQVYVRRDEEKVKTKARVMAQFLQPPPQQGRGGCGRGMGRRGQDRGAPSPMALQAPRVRLRKKQCAICKKKRHWKQECLQRSAESHEEVHSIMKTNY